MDEHSEFDNHIRVETQWQIRAKLYNHSFSQPTNFLNEEKHEFSHENTSYFIEITHHWPL